jgi:hypothetical protein
VIAFPMVVSDELLEGAKQATLPEEDEAVETLLPDRAHEALRVGVGIRRSDGHQHDPHPGALNDTAEVVGPLAVAIADENAVAHQEPIDRIGQSPRRLRHEPPIRGGRRAHHMNPSASEIEHEERVIGDQPARSPDLRGEEIGPRDLAQWARRNVRQDDGLSGAGGSPLSFRTLATVLLATPWPRFFSAPWIRV